MSTTTIAIVDDDPLNGVLLADVLRHHGYEVRYVADGDTFLASLHDAPPALVLLDIQMPGKSGVDVLLAMRDRVPHARIKVMALTASVMPHEIARFASLGFDDFHAKPVEVERLLDQIRALIGPATSTAAPRETGS